MTSLATAAATGSPTFALAGAYTSVYPCVTLMKQTIPFHESLKYNADRSAHARAPARLRMPLVAVITFVAVAMAAFSSADARGEEAGHLRLGERLLEFTGSTGHTYVDTGLEAGEVTFPVSFSIRGYWIDDGAERVKIWGWYHDLAGANRGELEIRNVGDDLLLVWYGGDTIRAPRPPANEWVHYGVIMTDSEARLYVNGEPVGSADSRSIDTGRTLWIGARPNPDMHEDNFSGWLRDWVVFDGDIGDAGMRSIAAGEELPAAGIIQHLPLTDGRGNTAFDRSGHGIHGTIVDASWSTDIPLLVARGERVAINLNLTDARGNPSPATQAYRNLISVSGGALVPESVDIESGEHTASFEWSSDASGSFSIAARHPSLSGDEHEIRVGILDALQHDGDEAVEQALHTIERIGVDSFVEKLRREEHAAALRALFEVIERGREPSRSRAIVTSVGLLTVLGERADAVIPVRIAFREGPVTAIRARAARALGELGDAASIAELRAAVADGEPEMRLNAAYALRALREPVELVFVNPYAGVSWETIGYYDANLHTHTNFSDGGYDPHYAIDTYHGMEYDILALTDHDSMHVDVWPRALYPWTALNEIYHQIKDERSVRFDAPYAEVVDEEWQNRDPDELGMVSIPGSEISRTHHIGSLFNHYAGGTEDEETAFREIGERGGLAMFFHPGRYNRDTEWYVDFYERHPHVVGMEVYNQVDRYPVDRRKWDSVLYKLMPDRPVWGFANDDTHSDAHFGRNRNVFMLSEFTKEHIFEAMKRGHLYFFVPEQQGTRPAVKLTGVTVTDDTIRLEIEGEYARIDWMTYNPETNDNHAVANGLEVAIHDLAPPTTFVRAVIISEEGRTYTQPFGVRAAVLDRVDE